ncbi:hypothetical protein AAG906_014358 [Vitis piasezkii]
MKVIAAYLLAVLGGNGSPCANDLKSILGSGTLNILFFNFSYICVYFLGKCSPCDLLHREEKLASVPSGGGVAVAAVAASGGGGGGGAAPASTEPKRRKRWKRKRNQMR